MNDSSIIFLEVLACGFFVILNAFNIIKNRSFFQAYLRFLFVRWKIITFIFAVSLLIILSYFVNDPTWDVGVSVLMGAMTYVFAPYTVFYLYDSIKKRKLKGTTFNALFFMIFSSGWTYDIYNYLKLGHIPNSWLENLILSSLIYLVAGFFWNLSEINEKPLLSIGNTNWPKVHNNIGIKTFLQFIVPIGICVSIFFLLFLFD